MSLVFQNVKFSYKENNKKTIFSNLNFTVNQKEKVGIYGKSGSGKSTLIKLITGEEKLNAGRIILNETDIKRDTNLFQKISIIFQDPEKQFLFPSIKDELDYVNSTNKRDISKQIKEILTKFSLPLEPLLKNHRNIYSLTWCELRIIQLAFVIFQEKPYLFLDDPNLFLDDSRKKVLYEILAQIDNKALIILGREKQFFSDIIDKEIFLSKF